MLCIKQGASFAYEGCLYLRNTPGQVMDCTGWAVSAQIRRLPTVEDALVAEVSGEWLRPQEGVFQLSLTPEQTQSLPLRMAQLEINFRTASGKVIKSPTLPLHIQKSLS